jgi:hypothetical protein
VDPRAIVALIVKTAGLLLAIYGVVLTPDRLAQYLMVEPKSGYLLLGTVLFPLAVSLALGALLFWFPNTVANAVAGKGTATPSDFDARLQVVVFSGVGLYVLVQGAITVVYYLALQQYVDELYSTGDLGDPAAKANLVSAGFSIVCGAVLLVGARGLSSLLRRVRA